MNRGMHGKGESHPLHTAVHGSLENLNLKTKQLGNLGHEHKSMKRNVFLLKFGKNGSSLWLYKFLLQGYLGF